MGWETRKGRRYYYEARKVGGRVVKTYVGNAASAAAHSMAGIVQVQRNQRTIMRQRQIEDIAAVRLAEFDEATATVDTFSQDVKMIADAAITAAGYHRHQRGAWRKRQMGTGNKQIGQGEAEKAELTPEVKADIRAMQRAQCGDASAVPAMRLALDRAMERNGGKLPEQMILFDQIVRKFAEQFTPGNDPNLMQRECTTRELKMLAEEVAGPNPSPLERLLAERVAVCYGHLQFAELLHQTAIGNRATQVATDLLLGRIDGAQKRYLAAIKALAEVRRLQIPALQIGQINVGEKQINVAASVP